MQAYNRREWTFLSGSLPSLYDSKVITIVYLHLANKISEDDPHTINTAGGDKVSGMKHLLQTPFVILKNKVGLQCAEEQG